MRSWLARTSWATDRAAGFGMHGKEHRGVGRQVDEGADRGQRLAQRLAEAFAAVRGEQDGARFAGKAGGRRRRLRRLFQQRVDHGVAAHQDAVVRDVLAAQVRGRGFGRRAMQRRRNGDGAAVKFLRKRRGEIAGAQAGFDVHKRNAAIKRRERRGKDRGGVALRDHQPGAERCEGRVELGRDRGQDRRDRPRLWRHREWHDRGAAKNRPAPAPAMRPAARWRRRSAAPSPSGQAVRMTGAILMTSGRVPTTQAQRRGCASVIGQAAPGKRVP